MQAGDSDAWLPTNRIRSSLGLTGEMSQAGFCRQRMIAFLPHTIAIIIRLAIMYAYRSVCRGRKATRHHRQGYRPCQTLRGFPS